MKFWLNGQLIENSGANIGVNGQISAQSAGLTTGWGVFTTLGVRACTPRFLQRHVQRLQRDSNEADVPFELDFNAISHAVNTVLRANSIQNGMARLTLTRRGDRRWNTQSGADFSVFALETEALNTSLNTSLRVQMSPFRVEGRRALVGVKVTSYLPYLWAWREAKSRGFDEAILRNGHEFWCEGARSTLFWANNGELFTPSLQTGCLRGIGRDLVLEWARAHQIPIYEGQFLDGDVETADEIWLVSGANGSRPVSALYDESGEIKANFTTKNTLCGDFARWFEAQSE